MITLSTHRTPLPSPLPEGEGAGFTLLELLVVIAVVAVLVGMLLPALGAARRSAQRVECMSNIRQLHIANDLYASDHDDHSMPGAAEIATKNLQRWHGVRKRTGERFEPEGAAITDYLDGGVLSRHVRACPSFAGVIENLADRGKGFESGGGGYGINNAFVGTQRLEVSPGVWDVRTNAVGSKRSRFASPTRTVGFADSAFAADELIEYSFVEPAWWPNFATWRPDPSVHFRHDGLAHVAWLDGHVSAQTMSHSESSGIYTLEPRAVGVGWFGDVSSNALFDYE